MHGNRGHAALARLRPSRPVRPCRPVLVPVADALRNHWRTATWLGFAAAAAITTLAPVLSLTPAGSSVLQPDPVRSVDLLLPLTGGAQAPAAIQGETLAQLLSLLLVIAAAACAVAVVTALTLQWTRAGARDLDTAVRRAVGASRRNLALSFLGEGMVLALTAVPLGLLMGYASLRIALRLWPDTVGAWNYSPAPIAIVTAVTLMLGALLPMRFARGRRLVNLPANPLSLFPPVIQVGASLAILLAATLVSRQATLLIGPGNTAAEGTVYQLVDAETDHAARAAQYVDMLRDLAAAEGIEAVSLTSPGALVGLGTVDWVEADCGQCFTGGMFVRFQSERAVHHVVSPDTFAVFGIPVVAGRAFTLDDGYAAGRVAIVNRQMAARHFENGNPLGRTIFMGTARVPYTVVGVVDDGKAPGRSGGVQPRFAVYLNTLQHPITATDLVVRGNAAAAARVLSARPQLQHSQGVAESAIRVAFTRPMAWFARWFRVEAIAALLFGALGTMVSVGLWVNALVPELAIHRALGATRRRIALRVLSRAVLIIGAGIFVALAAVGPSLRAVLSDILGDLPLLMASDLVVPGVLLPIGAMIGAAAPLRHATRSEPATLLADAS